jgi:hypothetical protein
MWCTKEDDSNRGFDNVLDLKLLGGLRAAKYLRYELEYTL